MSERLESKRRAGKRRERIRGTTAKKLALSHWIKLAGLHAIRTGLDGMGTKWTGSDWIGSNWIGWDPNWTFWFLPKTEEYLILCI